MHEALDHGHGPALTLQFLSDLIDLIGNLLGHQLFKKLVGMLGGSSNGTPDLLRG